MRDTAAFTEGAGGDKASFAALVSDAGIPALLRKGPWGALGGLLDFLRGTLTLGPPGVDILLQGNNMGRYASRVMAFGGRQVESRCDPKTSASLAE